MPKYSMPFIAKIHRFLKVCLIINNLENQKYSTKNYTYDYTRNSCKIFFDSPNFYKIEIRKLNHITDVLLRYFYQKSIRENYYFFDCPAQVYKNHYEKRKDIFLKKYIDAEEIDFIHAELNYLKDPKNNQILTIRYKCINKYLANKNKELINFDHLRNNQNSGESIIKFNIKSAKINYSQLIKTNDTWKYSYSKKIEFLNNRIEEINDLCISKPHQTKQTKREYNLTTNQMVILFDTAGFFSNPIFDNISKSKQSDLLGNLLNRNAKKIKDSIEKLDKSPKENGINYQKDIAKVEQLITDLRK